MAFTYDLTTDVGKVRLEYGDTDPASVLFQDAELVRFLEVEGNSILGAAAHACEALARRFSRRMDFQTDDQAFKASQLAGNFAAQAKELRSRTDAGEGTGTVKTKRVDGYSQDIDNESAEPTPDAGRVRIGYTDPDDRYGHGW